MGEKDLDTHMRIQSNPTLDRIEQHHLLERKDLADRNIRRRYLGMNLVS